MPVVEDGRRLYLASSRTSLTYQSIDHHWCVCLANELREDYQFVHTFEMSAAKQKYKVSPGSLVIFLSERFQTKYEAKWQVLDIKVCHVTRLLCVVPETICEYLPIQSVILST